jgi:hypothetical protein
MQKLNQVLAIERNTKSKALRETTSLHRDSSKPDLFNGFSKTYEPKDSEGDTYPPENKKAQLNAKTVLKRAEKTLLGLFDITLTKDSANQQARAAIVVDGETLLEDVPATTLLFLEKQLHDVFKLISSMPVLDPAYDWNLDEASSLFKTVATKTTKTKKVTKALVLHPPTKEHPAQTAQVNEDQTVGHWLSVRQSGALRTQDREEILERIEKLQNAVKYARENANSTEAPNKQMGSKVFGYLFNKS